MADNVYTVDGLVVRETLVGEADKLLTVLTSDNGRITVRAFGARSLKSRLVGTAQVLRFCRFQLTEKSGMYRVKDADILNGFYGLFDRLEGLTLAQYLIDVLAELTGEFMPDDGMLSLGLNTLYSLEKHTIPDARIKAAFELRAMSLCGYCPNLEVCPRCGRMLESDALPGLLNIPEGTVLCSDCYDDEMLLRYERTAALVSHTSVAAMRYVTECPDKRLFAFSVEGDAADEFYALCERYILTHLGKTPELLGFYKSLEFLGD